MASHWPLESAQATTRVPLPPSATTNGIPVTFWRPSTEGTASFSGLRVTEVDLASLDTAEVAGVEGSGG